MKEINKENTKLENIIGTTEIKKLNYIIKSQNEAQTILIENIKRLEEELRIEKLKNKE